MFSIVRLILRSYGYNIVVERLLSAIWCLVTLLSFYYVRNLKDSACNIFK